MFKNNNAYKILRIFLESPTNEFGLREIARKTKLAPASVKKYLNELLKEKIIEKTFSKDKPFYKAERDNPKFKTYQRLSIIYELEESGIIEYLWNKICPKAIILFGSYSKGEATEESDIDIFLITKKQNIEISKFQKNFKKEIQIFTGELNKIQPNLKTNILNGIILRGYLNDN